MHLSDLGASRNLNKSSQISFLKLIFEFLSCNVRFEYFPCIDHWQEREIVHYVFVVNKQSQKQYIE